ncbi:hypothetical protein Pint_24110 [Pistacia integerrima]|uniref:Uncharacterized protein n=1 Tax=Pistacia integerrima TaxID=434235 RepID=A0ACC0YH26_9ROSI|nr:hypothetical protein Pint_24110 [Pistacia integerrima]
MGNNVREVMELDLNSEPLEPPNGSMSGLGSLLNELETAHGRIEERIRQLERSPPGLGNARDGGSVKVGIDSAERIVENGIMGKRDASHLIAKALAVDTYTKQVESDRGAFFDCNICLHSARDPILTCCGHLFCWLCFYQVPYIYSYVKECPVCNGDVKDSSIIPIYGNGDNDNARKTKFRECLQIPPRPQAPRIESKRQQLINRGAFSSPIGVRIQQVSNVIDALGEQTRSADVDGVHMTSERTNLLGRQYSTPPVLSSTETEANEYHRSVQVSRLLSQGAASFSSLSSALNLAMDSAERLVEDLEAYINGNHVGRSQQESSHVDRDSFSSIAAVVQLESQSMDTAAEIESAVPPSGSPLRADAPGNVVPVGK